MADLRQIERRGWEVLSLASDRLQVQVVPGLGGAVVSLQRREDDLELLFAAPWGLRHRGAAALPGSAEAAMVDSYPGGWHTIFPNGGDAATAYGAEWGFDGEARVAWFDWLHTGSSLVLSARLVRSPFEITKIVSVRGDEVSVGETVKNVGKIHLDVLWGQQVAFGANVLGPGSVVDTSATLVRPDIHLARSAGYDDLLPWPRAYTADGVANLRTIPAPGRAETRMAYLSELGEPRVSLSSPAADLRVELSWDGGVWPHLWYNLEAGGRTAFPWFGTARFLALTPCTSWPAHGVHDARRVSASTLRIHPGVARTSHLSVRVSRPSVPASQRPPASAE